MKKLKQPLLYTLSALSSVVVDLGLFYLLRVLLGTALGGFAESVCTVGARAISSFYNFNVNNRVVFNNRGAYGKAMLRYYCLALPQLAASALLLTLFVYLLGVSTAKGSTMVKLVVDSCLFVASFFIQKFWVFAQKHK